MMLLAIQREASTPYSTPGNWLVNEKFSCFSLEDPVREIPGVPVSQWKIPGNTAIPAGRYGVVYDRSERFSAIATAKARLSDPNAAPVDVFTLRLVNVPGFDGIRVHGGNGANATEGCPLAGLMRKGPDRISVCAPAVQRLEALVIDAIKRGEEVWCDVRPAQKAVAA